MPAHRIPAAPTDVVGTGWSVHVEFQVDGHPDDEVMQAAAAALVQEMREYGAAAFGGRGVITLICASPETDLPPEDALAASARAIDAALKVVSRFAPIRRIHSVERSEDS